MGIGSEGVVSRDVPQKFPENQPAPPRFSPFREPTVGLASCDHELASDEGSLFTAKNVTPGTGLAYTVTAAFVDTAALLTIRNTESDPNGRRIILKSLRIIVTAVPATATSGHCALKIEPGSSAARASAGTVLTGGSTNSFKGSDAVADIRVTPTVAAATGATRLVDSAVLRTAIPVVFDEWLLTFGNVDAPGTVQLAGAAAQRMVVPFPAVVLGPGGQLLLHAWFPGNAVTPLSAEIAACYKVR